jgi:hypothetical protein
MVCLLAPMAIVVFAICVMKSSLMTFIVLFSMVLVKTNFLHTHYFFYASNFILYVASKNIRGTNISYLYILFDNWL